MQRFHGKVAGLSAALFLGEVAPIAFGHVLAVQAQVPARGDAGALEVALP